MADYVFVRFTEEQMMIGLAIFWDKMHKHNLFSNQNLVQMHSKIC